MAKLKECKGYKYCCNGQYESVTVKGNRILTVHVHIWEYFFEVAHYMAKKAIFFTAGTSKPVVEVLVGWIELNQSTTH